MHISPKWVQILLHFDVPPGQLTTLSKPLGLAEFFFFGGGKKVDKSGKGKRRGGREMVRFEERLLPGAEGG